MTITDRDPTSPTGDRRARRLRLVGLALVAIPFAMFLLFAVGEAASPEPGWWSHLLQVAAVGVLAALAWRRPRIGGPLLVVVGATFSVLAIVAINDELVSRLAVVGVFLAPLMAAGACFTLAGRGGP